jgi:hypothetical protein
MRVANNGLVSLGQDRSTDHDPDTICADCPAFMHAVRATSTAEARRPDLDLTVPKQAASVPSAANYAVSGLALFCGSDPNRREPQRGRESARRPSERRRGACHGDLRHLSANHAAACGETARAGRFRSGRACARTPGQGLRCRTQLSVVYSRREQPRTSSGPSE